MGQMEFRCQEQLAVLFHNVARGFNVAMKVRCPTLVAAMDAADDADAFCREEKPTQSQMRDEWAYIG